MILKNIVTWKGNRGLKLKVLGRTISRCIEFFLLQSVRLLDHGPYSAPVLILQSKNVLYGIWSEFCKEQIPQREHFLFQNAEYGKGPNSMHFENTLFKRKERRKQKRHTKIMTSSGRLITLVILGT